MNDICVKCGSFSPTLYLEGDRWICRHCRSSDQSDLPYLKESGGNPYDPKASKVHLKDVQDRRWHPDEKRTFYRSKEMPKSYFLPKG